jgi:hypothetical protein
MSLDEPPQDGNIPDFSISKNDISHFEASKRIFGLPESYLGQNLMPSDIFV